jgi:hypothetical protein
MRKLKLESLHVESFDTTADATRHRGTVDGHADVAPDTRACPVDTIEPNPSYCVICYPVSYDHRCTYDPRECGDTNYMDCTFGCSQYNSCKVCWIEETKACTID